MWSTNQNFGMQKVKLSPEICNDMNQIKQKRKDMNGTQLKITELNDKLVSSSLNDDEKESLTTLYKTGIETSQKEEALLRSVLSKVQELIDTIEKEKVEVKKEVTSPSAYLYEEDQLKKGDKVSARLTGEGNWILATFVATEKNRYEVEDVEDVERKKYKVAKNRVIALDKVFDEDTVIEKGNTIMAVFPETTTFYQAVVEKSATVAHPYYYVRFEDDEDDYGNVPNRKIPFNQTWDPIKAK
jgi:hypothetical protein